MNNQDGLWFIRSQDGNYLITSTTRIPADDGHFRLGHITQRYQAFTLKADAEAIIESLDSDNLYATQRPPQGVLDMKQIEIISPECNCVTLDIPGHDQHCPHCGPFDDELPY